MDDKEKEKFGVIIDKNDQDTENQPKVDEENQLRNQSERLISTQRVQTAKSGITMSGSPMQALADTYFNTEYDALKIQYASDIQQTQKISAATLLRAEGAARSSALRTRAYQSLLESGSKAARLV